MLYADQWRSYTGRKPRRHAALVALAKAGTHQVSLPMARFLTEDGTALDTYDYLTSLILTPAQKERPETVGEQWDAEVPRFKNLRWVGGEFLPRQRPYLNSGAADVDAAAAFRGGFDEAVNESVEREDQSREER